MAAGLTSYLLAVATEKRGQPHSGDISRQLQAGMTSSFTT